VAVGPLRDVAPDADVLGGVLRRGAGPQVPHRGRGRGARPEQPDGPRAGAARASPRRGLRLELGAQGDDGDGSMAQPAHVADQARPTGLARPGARRGRELGACVLPVSIDITAPRNGSPLSIFP